MSDRTLADMTAEERQQIVGRWVKVTPAGGNSPSRTPFLGVLANLDANGFWGTGGHVVRGPHISPWRFAEMELQEDLLPAWTPDGKPLPGKWLRVKVSGVTLTESERSAADYERFTTDWMEARDV